MKMHRTNRLKIHRLNNIPLMTTATPKRISGAELYKTKWKVYSRDGGRCALCNTPIEMEYSELDHRIALQFCPAFGFTPDEANSTRNLWTLCKPCHEGKTARERATNQADRVALSRPAPADVAEGRSPGIV